MIISDTKLGDGKSVQVYSDLEDEFDNACFGDLPVSVLDGATFMVGDNICSYEQARAVLCDWQTVYFV